MLEKAISSEDLYQLIFGRDTAVLAGWLTHLNFVLVYKLYRLCETLRSVVYHLGLH